MKLKRILCLLLAVAMILGTMSFSVFADEVTVAETSTHSKTYTSEDGYWGECTGSADESFVLKFYNGTTYMGQTSLNNVDNIIDGDVTVTWNMKLDAASNTDEYWTMAWESQPTVNMQPDRVEHWVDGVMAAEGTISPNRPDDGKPVVAMHADSNGIIKGYVLADGYVNNPTNVRGNLTAAIENAGNNDTIALMADVEQIPVITKPITIDGQGHKVTAKADENQFGEIDGTVTLKNLVYEVGTEAIRTDYGNYGGESDGYTKLSLVIDGCTFNNLTGYAIMGGQTGEKTLGGLTVSSCVFNSAENNTNYLVWAQQVKTFNVTGCMFNGNGAKGAIHTGEPTSIATVANISGNKIDNVQRGVQIGNRVQGSSVSISGNTFTNITGADKTGAVYVHSNSDTATTDVQIENNAFNSASAIIYNNGKKAAALNEMITFAEGNTQNDVPVTEVKTAGTEVTVTAAANAVTTMAALQEALQTENSAIKAGAVLTVAAGETVNLDLNGCTVNMGAYYIENNGTLTVTNGTIIADTTNDETNGAPLWNNGAMTVNANVTGVIAAIRQENGTLTVDGGELTVTNTNGVSTNHIIRVKGGEAIVNDGSFKGNQTANLGGGCMMMSWSAGKITINGGNFDNFNIYGNAIFGMGGANATIKGGTYTNVLVEGTSIAQCLADYLADGYTVEENKETGTGTVNPAPVAGLSGSGTVDEPYLINNLEELKWFRDDVNAGNTYSTQYVKLTGDIDLNNEEWTPIGNSTNKFLGHFDGGSNTVSNLKIDNDTSYVGFFGYTSSGSLKNLTIKNVDIDGRLGVGALAGCPFTSDVENITLTGKVTIDAGFYVGGVVGRNAYGDLIDITVDVTDDSYVKANSIEEGTSYRTYVGGVVGFLGEGNGLIKNVTSNIKVIGNVKDIGGITGIAHYGNTFENVTFTGKVEAPADAEEVGAIAGVWHNQKENKVTFTNVTSTGTVTVGNEDVSNAIVGGAYNPDNYTPNNSGSLVIDGIDVWTAVAKIGDNKYPTLAEAVAAANSGETIALVADIADVNTSISKNITLDLGTNTLTDAKISISGDVTIKNGAIKNHNTTNVPLTIGSGGKLTVEDVDIEASKTDRAIYVNGGELTFNSGSILVTRGEGNSKNQFAAIWMFGGHAYINGGTITVDDETAKAKVHGVFGNYPNANVTMNGGKISTNGGNYSYAIWVDGDVTINDGEIVTNEKGYGYSSGIRYGSNYAINNALGDITITGGTITTNGYSGYIVNVGRSYQSNEQKVEITGGTFKNDLSEVEQTAGGHKAPVLVWEGSASPVTATITNGNFEGFSADLLRENNADTTLDVSGGTFDIEINEEYLADGFKQEKNDDGTYGVVEKNDYVAQIGDVKYETLEEAFAAAKEGSKTITILNDVTLTDAITINDGMDVTVDGKGKTITGASGKDVFYVTGGKLTLNEGLNVVAPTDCCIYIRGGEVVTSANLTKKGEKYSAIQGNGSYVGDVTINGGKIVNEITDKVAIYWPQNGKLTINGGEIIGGTGIRLSSGSLEITGGTVTANGKERAYVTSDGGSVVDTGDAVMIENIGGTTGYEAITAVSITGGTFTSANAEAVASYTAGIEGVEAVKGFITGGIYSTDVSDLCADGYSALPGLNGSYVAGVDTSIAKVYTYDELVAALDNEGIKTIKFAKDITVPANLNVIRSVTIDGCGFDIKYTNSGDAARVITVLDTANGADLTVKNLEINFEGGWTERGINYNTGGTLTIENVKVNGEDVNYAVNLPGSSDGATVVITDSELTAAIPLNIWGTDVTATVTNSSLMVVDETDEESYAAVAVNNGADNTNVTVTGGEIYAMRGSVPYRNYGMNSSVEISETTEVTSDNESINTLVVAKVAYAGSTQHYSFANLKDAVDKATDDPNATVVLLNDTEVTESIKVTGTVTVDLNGKKITGPDDGKANYYAFIVDGGNLTLKDSSEEKTGEIWAKCYGVETKSGSFTMESGKITATNNKTLGSAVVNYGGTVTINGGVLNGALSSVTTGGYFSEAETVIKGGTLTGPVALAAEYNDKGSAIKSANDTYPIVDGYEWKLGEDSLFELVVKEEEKVLPNATVKDLGQMTISDYDIYDVSLTEGDAPIDLQIAMEFIANDTVDEAKDNYYGEYTTDFFITIDGLESETLDTTGCYLAGNYGAFGWIMIPLDGLTIENGQTYSVITSVGFDFSYIYICDYVKDFKCGIYLTEEVLEKNPNLKLNLELGLSKDIDAALSADFTKVGGYEYTNEDFAMDKDAILSKCLVVSYMDEKVSEDGTKYHPIQFLAGIDSLKYKEVGFKVRAINSDKDIDITKVLTTTNVYDAMKVIEPSGDSATYDAADFGGIYLFGLETGFAKDVWTNSNTTIYVTPYAKKLDGTEITGVTKQITDAAIKKQHNNSYGLFKLN